MEKSENLLSRYLTGSESSINQYQKFGGIQKCILVSFSFSSNNICILIVFM